MEDIYKSVLYIQEMCGNLKVVVKTINDDIKKFYNKDDTEAIGRIQIAMDSVKSTVNNLEMMVNGIEKGE